MRAVIAEDLALLRDGLAQAPDARTASTIAAAVGDAGGPRERRSTDRTGRTSPSWTCGCRPPSPTRAWSPAIDARTRRPRHAGPGPQPVRRAALRPRAACARAPRRDRLPAQGPRRGGRARCSSTRSVKVAGGATVLDPERGRRDGVAARATQPAARPADRRGSARCWPSWRQGRSNAAIAAATWSSRPTPSSKHINSHLHEARPADWPPTTTGACSRSCATSRRTEPPAGAGRDGGTSAAASPLVGQELPV